MRKFLLLLLLGVLLFPHRVLADNVDISISASGLRFSEDKLYAGDNVRIYATIKNLGDTDVTAQVFFYQGAILIGKSQEVSVLADGSSDDVYVDFTVPEGSFNIRAVIQGADPTDTNSSNNVAVTPLYQPIVDDDRDGRENEDDNCFGTPNPDQKDTDVDGKGDACDPDDDNDGLLDVDEEKKGTSSTNADSDGDGVNDKDDAFPTDPSKSKAAVIAPVVPKTETPAPKPAAPVPVAAVTPVPKPVETAPVEAPLVVSESATNTPAEENDDSALPLVLGAAIKASPEARFTFRQTDWRTYEFEATPPADQGGFSYGWDFGDGATSVQQKITHAFPRAGEYTVTLGIADREGVIRSDAQVFEISFFHLDNPLVQLTLGGLFVIILGLIAFLMKAPRQKV